MAQAPTGPEADLSQLPIEMFAEVSKERAAEYMEVYVIGGRYELEQRLANSLLWLAQADQ